MLLPHVLGPVIEAVDAEIRMITVRPDADASSDTAVTQEETDERPTSPEGVEFYNRLDEYEPSPDEEVRSPVDDQP